MPIIVFVHPKDKTAKLEAVIIMKGDASSDSESYNSKGSMYNNVSSQELTNVSFNKNIADNKETCRVNHLTNSKANTISLFIYN